MSKIEWTEKTWNPVTGCDKISQGCLHCYAADIAKRFWGDRPFSDVQFHPERLDEPLKRRKPTMWFVNSMSDLFHDAVNPRQIAAIWNVMERTPHHTYQILTKRPQRSLEIISKLIRMADGNIGFGAGAWVTPIQPLPNVWLGVTVENQRAADERIPLLLQTPAAVRFLSCEPLLEEVNILGVIERYWGKWIDFEGKPMFDGSGDCESGIDWVIVGGESGSKARPCDIAWIESVVTQCKNASVPVFVKQLGTHPVIGMDSDNPIFYSASTGKGNIPDKWPESIRVREYPA